MPKIPRRICVIVMARWNQNLQRWIEHGEGKKEIRGGPRKQEGNGKNRNHRWQRPVSHGRADRHPRSAGENAVWRSFGRDCNWNVGRAARSVPGPPWTRAPLYAERHQLSREYLRNEDAWRRTDSLGERGGISARRSAADGLSDRGSVLRPHAPARFVVFRRGEGDWGARGVRQSAVHAFVGARGGRLRCGGSKGASWRDLRVHGRSAIFHRGGIEYLPATALRRDRHDQSDGGEAGPRGRTLLRDNFDDHRLRLLASAARLGYGCGNY